MLHVAQSSRQWRYYFQLVKPREEMTSMTAAERVRICRNHGISDTPSYLETLALELDTILSRPINPMHCEFLGLSRRLYALIVDKILQTKAFPTITTVFRGLQLPTGWSRIQSMEKHIGSWTASDAAKASITMPILLRQWLHRQYVRPDYLAALSRSAPKSSRLSHITDDINYIVFCSAQFAESCSIISSKIISVADQARYNDVVLAGRKYWLQLIKAGSSLQVTKTIPLRVEPSRRQVLSASRGSVYLNSPRMDIPTDESFYDAASESSAEPYTPAFSRYNARQLSQLTRLQQTENLVQSTGGVDNLPNFHTGAHFELMRQEYGNLWIAIVFWGEDKHRFFKDRASRINHHNPERDLLDKERIHASIRGIVNEGFSYSCMEAAQQLDRLVKKYPQVFKSNLSFSDKLIDAQLAQSRVTVKLYEQISKQQFHGHQIPDHITKWGSVDRGRFRTELRQFNIDRFDERREVFHWYKSC
ncbi:hypothetical protein K3495_g11591 [Podosphaera aphanis]|nr:hypothetical protein K3495_g11591 [Podosphaera aphanis]